MQKNRIELAGYLVTKPEARFLPSGTKVANVRLKESYRFNGTDGKQQTHANWHSVVSMESWPTSRFPLTRTTTSTSKGPYSNGGSRRPTASRAQFTKSTREPVIKLRHSVCTRRTTQRARGRQ